MIPFSVDDITPAWLSDVLDNDVRVPLLVFSSEVGPGYSNEFFFEPVATMGDRRDVVRIQIPGMTHMELSDIMFMSTEERGILPGGGVGDGSRAHDIITGFMRAFFDTHLKGAESGYPASQFAQFPDVETVDVSYVKTWAATR